MDFSPDQLWNYATEEERRTLEPIYSRMRALPVLDDEARQSPLKMAVRCAEVLEIMMDYNYKRWSTKYQLKPKTVQRINYLKLVLGGNDRHKDVAYGLSEKFEWSDKSNVISQLMSMGRRDYKGEIPTSHENDNGVLHVAVSYRHSGKAKEEPLCLPKKSGTLSEAQAEAIWVSVQNLLNVFRCMKNAEVRVWIDQNLHRKKFPDGTEWHEFGLVPYACLRTVCVGAGDFSLKHAYTRPWLWVEMITALKSDGIHTKPGYNLFEDCADVISPLEEYERNERLCTNVTRNGWLLGPGRNVDETMSEITRLISLWRRKDFLDHNGYSFADEFERFVNWARWFVIRGIPYSEMAWNHDSSEVCGMDAVVLVRELPSSGWRLIEGALGIVQANVMWKPDPLHGNWVIGDLIDRSLVGELPLNEVMETRQDAEHNCEDLTLFGKSSGLEGITFRKTRQGVGLILHPIDGLAGNISNRLDDALIRLDEDCRTFATNVTLTVPDSEGKLLQYRPFTHRVSFIRSAGLMPVGDAWLRPASVDGSMKSNLGLQRFGLCFNSGIFERVYTVQVGNRKYPVSTNEVAVLFNAVSGDTERFKEMVAALKRNALYKFIRYKDLSELERLSLTRGWRAESVQIMCNEMFISGEIESDVEDELIGIIRRRNHGRTLLVWVDDIRQNKVRISFVTESKITYVVSETKAATRELAIAENAITEELFNSDSSGLVQMLPGVQPEFNVRAYGSSLNPNMEADSEGTELNLRIVNGLFAQCDCCAAIVCPLNGLRAELNLENDVYHLAWIGPHMCKGHEYVLYNVQRGFRVV